MASFRTAVEKITNQIRAVRGPMWAGIAVAFCALGAVIGIENKYSRDVRVAFQLFEDYHRDQGTEVRYRVEDLFNQTYKSLSVSAAFSRYGAYVSAQDLQEISSTFVDSKAISALVLSRGTGNTAYVERQSWLGSADRNAKLPPAVWEEIKKQGELVRKAPPTDMGERPPAFSSVAEGSSGPEFVVYSVPILNREGRAIGLVTGLINLDVFRRMMPSDGYQVFAQHHRLVVRRNNVRETSSLPTGVSTTLINHVNPLGVVDETSDWRMVVNADQEEFDLTPEVEHAADFRSQAHLTVALLAGVLLAGIVIRTRLNFGGPASAGRMGYTTELVHAHKMESIGHLAAGVAHEINTPTQYIGDNLRFLETAYGRLEQVLVCYDQLYYANKNGQRVDEHLETLQSMREKFRLTALRQEIPCAIDEAVDGIQRVNEIIRAMRDYAHPGISGVAQSDVNQVIERSVTVSRSEWKYVADMKLDLAKDLPTISCNPGEIGQVILNLLINASHAIKARGAVERGQISVTTRLANDHQISISISDSGMGIPAGVQPRIFEEFFTTKELGVGTGMGLAIAQRVIKSHKGTISFTTEENVGTTFTILLPVAQFDEAAA